MHSHVLEVILKVVHVLVCVFLVLVVLIQPGKGGMSAGLGGGSTQVFGGRGAGNLLTKATGIAATIFMLTSASLAYTSSSGDRALKAKAASVAAEDKKKISKGGAMSDKGSEVKVAPAVPAGSAQ